MKLISVIGAMCLTITQYHLYSDHGSLKPDQLHRFVEVKVQADTYVHLKGAGDNKGGDLDCYLLAKGQKGWGIVARDEGSLDSCDLGYYSGVNDTIRVWYANHGGADDSYTLTVDQETVSH